MIKIDADPKQAFWYRKEPVKKDDTKFSKIFQVLSNGFEKIGDIYYG